MNLPGFTAEASLYSTSKCFITVRKADAMIDSPKVLPQLCGAIPCSTDRDCLILDTLCEKFGGGMMSTEWGGAACVLCV